MKLLVVALGAVLLAASCSILESDRDDYDRRLAIIEAELRAEVGEARADTVAQCAALLYGSKPCGGHWRSLVYSTVDGRQARIHALADEYTSVQAEMNRRFGIASDCAMEPIPVPDLVDGMCVAAGETWPE